MDKQAEIRQVLGSINNAFSRMPYGGGLFKYHSFETTDELTQLQTVKENLERLIVQLKSVSEQQARDHAELDKFHGYKRALGMLFNEIMEVK